MKLVLHYLLWLCSLAVYGQGIETLSVQSNKPVFTISLAGNATTGFEWSVVDYNKELFTLTNSHYEPPHTKLVGAGGQMIFTFKLNPGKKYPKTSTMHFKYARSWEPQSATRKELVINFLSS